MAGIHADVGVIDMLKFVVIALFTLGWVPNVFGQSKVVQQRGCKVLVRKPLNVVPGDLVYIKSKAPRKIVAKTTGVSVTSTVALMKQEDCFLDVRNATAYSMRIQRNAYESRVSYGYNQPVKGRKFTNVNRQKRLSHTPFRAYQTSYGMRGSYYKRKTQVKSKPSTLNVTASGGFMMANGVGPNADLNMQGYEGSLLMTFRIPMDKTTFIPLTLGPTYYSLDGSTDYQNSDAEKVKANTHMDGFGARLMTGVGFYANKSISLTIGGFYDFSIGGSYYMDFVNEDKKLTVSQDANLAQGGQKFGLMVPATFSISDKIDFGISYTFAKFQSMNLGKSKYLASEDGSDSIELNEAEGKEFDQGGQADWSAHSFGLNIGIKF